MPGLNFPIRADTSQFDQAMERARNNGSAAARMITQSFVNANKELISALLAGAASVIREYNLIGLAARAAFTPIMNVALLVAAYKAISASIQAVKDDLEEMAEIAEKATRAGVSPEFFQSFIAGARNAKVSVEDLEEALLHASRQVRDTMNPDWSVWDTVLKKVTDVEKKMVGLRELFDVSQRVPTGVQVFRDARDDEQRIRAVVTFMKELEEIGQRLAVLDLAEAVFGAKTADNLRQGKITVDELSDSVNKLASGTHASELVNRTKDVNEELDRAYGQLERAIRPTLDGIASKVNEIKSTWASLVSLLAQAYEIWSKLPGVGALATVGGTSGPGLRPAERGAQSFDEAGFVSGGGVPLPRRRPSDAPKARPEAEAAETVTAFQSATDAINRQIASLTADAAAVGKTAAEHQQLRVEMRLLEAARQSGVEITDEQIQAYAQLRASMGAEQALAAAGIQLNEKMTESFVGASRSIRLVVGALDDKRRAFQAVNDAVRFAGNELIDVIDRATQKGADFGQIMSDVFRNIAKQALQAAITGEGAFAKLFGTASTTGGVGGLGGLIAALFGGGSNPVVPGATNLVGIAGSTPVPTFFAAGGRADAGELIYAGEHGPNPKLFRAPEPMVITPGDVRPVSAGGGGPVQLNMPISIDARGAQLGVAEQIETAMRQVPGMVERTINDMRRYDHRALR